MGAMMVIKAQAERVEEDKILVIISIDGKQRGALDMSVGAWQMFGACLIHGIKGMQSLGMPVSYDQTDCIGLNDPKWDS